MVSKPGNIWGEEGLVGRSTWKAVWAFQELYMEVKIMNNFRLHGKLSRITIRE